MATTNNGDPDWTTWAFCYLVPGFGLLGVEFGVVVGVKVLQGSHWMEEILQRLMHLIIFIIWATIFCGS